MYAIRRWICLTQFLVDGLVNLLHVGLLGETTDVRTGSMARGAEKGGFANDHTTSIDGPLNGLQLSQDFGVPIQRQRTCLAFAQQLGSRQCILAMHPERRGVRLRKVPPPLCEGAGTSDTARTSETEREREVRQLV